MRVRAREGAEVREGLGGGGCGGEGEEGGEGGRGCGVGYALLWKRGGWC